MLPAGFGLAAWALLGNFSPTYAVFNGLWCVTFIEYWKRQELDLGVRWGVRGVSAIQKKRRDFTHEKEVKDPVTGETVQVFPATKRLSRQLLSIPFALLAILALGTLIATCFGIEIFLSEVYNGPFKSVLVSHVMSAHKDLTETLSGISAYRTADHARAYFINFVDQRRHSPQRIRELGDPRELRVCHDSENFRP